MVPSTPTVMTEIAVKALIQFYGGCVALCVSVRVNLGHPLLFVVCGSTVRELDGDSTAVVVELSRDVVVVQSFKRGLSEVSSRAACASI